MKKNKRNYIINKTEYNYYYHNERSNYDRLRNEIITKLGKGSWESTTQENLAELIGISRTSYNLMINNETKLSLDMLVKVQYLTGLSYEEIIQEEIKLGNVNLEFKVKLINGDSL